MKKLVALFVLLLTLACCTTEADRTRMRAALDSINQRNRSDQPFTVQDVEPYVQFFDRHGTPNDRLLAHYLLGRAYHEQGEAPMALECYQKAAECADTTSKDCDYRQLCRVYGQMSDIFYYQGLYRNSLQSDRMSVCYAWLGKDTLAALLSYEQQSQSYRELNMPDSMLLICETAHRLYNKYGYFSKAAVVYGYTLSTLIERKEFEKAKQRMNLYESRSHFFDSVGNIEKGREVYYNIKGTYYNCIGKRDSAKYFFLKELSQGKDFNNQNAAAMKLASFFLDINRLDSAAKYLQYAYAMNDSLHDKQKVKAIERIHSMYNYSHHKEKAILEHQIAEKQKSMKNQLVILLVVVVVTSILVVHKIHVDKERKIELYKQNIERLEQGQSEILSLREYADEITTLLAKKDDEIKEYLSELNVYISEKEQRMEEQSGQQSDIKLKILSDHASIEKNLRESEILKRIANRKKIAKLSVDEIREFHKKTIELLPQFNTILLSKQNRLNAKDFNVCMLFRFGFNSKTISYLLGISQARVSQICSKVLKNVFHEEKGGAQELIDFLYKLY